jgi:hypothetical protein
VQLAAHFDDSGVVRVARVAQQTPVVQLFVPEQAKTSPLHTAVVAHASRPLVTQHTCVAESQDLPSHAIWPAPPSVPRGGVVWPPPGFAASASVLASSSPVLVLLSSPPLSVASSPTLPPPLLVPVLLSSPPAPLLLAAPEPELLSEPELPPLPPSPAVVVAPDPLHPRMITNDAPQSARKADIEVPPLTYFARRFQGLSGRLAPAGYRNTGSPFGVTFSS